MRTTIVAVSILLISPRAADAAPREKIEVLSVVGTARADGRRLEAGVTLRAGTVVELVSRDAAVQLVLAGRLAVGLCDRASARLLGAGVDVLLDEGVARLAGRGTVVSGRLRARLGGDGVLLVQGRRFFVQEGRVTARSVHAKARVAPGRVVRVAPSGDLELRRAEPPAAAVARTLTYQPPPPWDPGEDPVRVETQLKKTQRRVRARQQRERELATCGCTEGSGPGVGVDRGRNRTAIEGRRGTVRVRVRGIPGRIK